MAKDISTQERGRWEWDEGPSGKTQEKRNATSDKPPLLRPSYTHTHTQKQASRWQVAQLVGVCLWRSTDAHGDACLSVKEVSSIAGTLRRPWLINIHRSSRRLLWTEGRKKKKSNYEAMFCQMDKKRLVRRFAGYLPFDHCVCTSRFPGDKVC